MEMEKGRDPSANAKGRTAMPEADADLFPQGGNEEKEVRSLRGMRCDRAQSPYQGENRLKCVNAW